MCKTNLLVILFYHFCCLDSFDLINGLWFVNLVGWGVNCNAEPFFVEFLLNHLFLLTNYYYYLCYPFHFELSFENIFPPMCLLKQVGSPWDIKAGGGTCQAAKLRLFL